MLVYQPAQGTLAWAWHVCYHLLQIKVVMQMVDSQCLTIVGGGLAGCEAAWQAAQRGLEVTLYEMRPQVMTPAHKTDRLAELVCSNSLGSTRSVRAPGMLKAELTMLGSLILRCAQETRVPAGGALAVGREAFAERVTKAIEAHPRITLVREEVQRIPDGVAVMATGPLTSDAMATEIARLTGESELFFFDAMAPIVTADSIDTRVAFSASRYDRGEADYINCPMTRAQYSAFVAALVEAERIPLADFERNDKRFFEACLPVEVLASRGHDALAYGPLRPVGLVDPLTGKRPYAVVQLRQDNLAGSLYNLVGFQTNLRWPEQKRVFGMIPGLEHAEWVRYGQMHRNTYINSPKVLMATLQLASEPRILFAGQICGTEGYVGSTASGLVAGINAARLVRGQTLIEFPRSTMLGSLLHYVSSSREAIFQPMKPNFGILAPLDPPVRKKLERYDAFAERSMQDMAQHISAVGLLADLVVPVA